MVKIQAPNALSHHQWAWVGHQWLAWLNKTLPAPTPLIFLDGLGSENKALSHFGLIGWGSRQGLSLRDDQLSWQTPEKTITQTVLPEALLACVRQAYQQAVMFENEANLPFNGGLFGFLSYEAAGWFEPALFGKLKTQSQPEAWPTMLWLEPETTLTLLPKKQEAWLLGPIDKPLLEKLEQLLKQAACFEPILNKKALLASSLEPMNQQSLSPKAFEAAVGQLKRWIEEGQLFQGNLSVRFEKQLDLPLDPLALALLMAQQNPSPFSATVKACGGWLLSNSPERLVKLDKAGRVETRPIAGTRGRADSKEADNALGEALLANPKERAEHLMLVDLERNDLGRVCVPGSVAVTELLSLERYSHVTHLVSNVQGQLKPGLDALDLLQATFPGGTITGCPKIRCMELLSQLEPHPRSFYTGSLGYWDRATGACDFNILIRTLGLSLEATQANLQVGAGIVADSIPENEYRECLRKAAAWLSLL